MVNNEYVIFCERFGKCQATKHKLFFDPEYIGISKEDVFFAETREEKLKKIAQLKCDWFIDDLPEIFELHDFPKKTKKILFDPDKNHKNFDGGEICSSWENIQEVIN